MNVAVLGASTNPHRYANLAVERLLVAGHSVFPVHPSGNSVHQVKTSKSLKKIKEKIDTLTVYVKPKISQALSEEILNLHPDRIIFNPGAENPILKLAAESKGIQTLQACTLVLLSSNQF